MIFKDLKWISESTIFINIWKNTRAGVARPHRVLSHWIAKSVSIEKRAVFKSRKILFLAAVFILSLTVHAAAENLVVRKEARLLEAPDVDALILDILSPGMVVEVIRSQGNWARVRVPATTEMGWVQKGYLFAEGEASRAGLSAVGSQRMTSQELENLQEQINVTDQSVSGVEAQVEVLIREMEERGYIPRKGIEPARLVQQMVQPQAPSIEREVKIEAIEEIGPGKDYRWRNQFYLGTYIKGGENFYGITVGRFLDSRGWLMLDGEVHYALGDDRGKRDDFVSWSAGLNFNLRPMDFMIYPFFSMHFGQRHLLASPFSYKSVSPGIGINAELGSIFSLSAEAREVFLFRQGNRSDETRINLSVSYKY